MARARPTPYLLWWPAPPHSADERDAKSAEINSFQAKYGYAPTLLPTSIDMLAVYVHRNNPLESLTFTQVDSIFSSTRKQGGKEQAKTWGQVGVTGDAASQNITCYGRNAASGTYGYFKEKVLADGDYGTWVSELPGSSAVVQAVGENAYGIGYSGIGYSTANVKTLAIDKGDGTAVKAEPAHAYDGSYPLARSLYIAVKLRLAQEARSVAGRVHSLYLQQARSNASHQGWLPARLGREGQAGAHGGWTLRHRFEVDLWLARRMPA